jgi:signal transduction histidine kinase
MAEDGLNLSAEKAEPSSGVSAAAAPASEIPLVERLEKECRHCSQAAATAAHDMKTPLAILSGYVDLLTTTKLGPLTPRQDAVLKEMSENLARLRRFTDEFLTYYTVRAGLELQLDASDLNQCLVDIFRTWAPEFTKKGVAFYWLPSEHLPLVAFDYHKMQHIISNLLDNALKFTPPGGSVWIHTEDYFWERRALQQKYEGKERRASRTSRPNCARVNVSDTGPGIAPDKLHEIFEEFRQVAIDGRRPQGTGLGLAIAKRLIEMHNGKIWVESELGHGSKFSVVLPHRSHKPVKK